MGTTQESPGSSNTFLPLEVQLGTPFDHVAYGFILALRCRVHGGSVEVRGSVVEKTKRREDHQDYDEHDGPKKDPLVCGHRLHSASRLTCLDGDSILARQRDSLA